MRDKKHVKLLDETRRGVTAGLKAEWMASTGYEETDMGEGNVWIHGDGRDDCTVWVEMQDGRMMLCVGDHLGRDARSFPLSVAHVLSLEFEVVE